MQPARQDLPVVPGTTYRDTVRLMQPDYAYKLITQISGAPAVLSVPQHGLAGDWPVWVRGVAGLPAIAIRHAGGHSPLRGSAKDLISNRRDAGDEITGEVSEI